jgi:Cu/Ag efflux pump CusA
MNAASSAVDNGLLSFTAGSVIGSGGLIESANQRLGIRNQQVINTPQQLANVTVARRGSHKLTIGDLAHVRYGTPPLIGTAVVNGQSGIMLVIEKFPGANTLQVTNGILKAFAALRPGLPGIHVDTHVFRQSTFIHTAIHNLTIAVVLGCILVVFVLIAFLFQARAALVSLLAIPLSLAAAAVVLDAEGTTINTMILAGFGVAVGVVVDDAIIDMENIVRRLRIWRTRGRRTTPLHLLLAASLEVRTAILYATVINIVAVLPVVFVGGLTQSFFRPLAVAYGLAVLASMFVALTVTPALAMVLMPSAKLGPRDPPLMGLSKRAYRAVLQPALRRPRLAMATVPLAILAAALVLPGLGQDLFPTFKEQDLLMHFDTKPGTSLREMKRIVTRLQGELLRIPGVAQVGSHIAREPGQDGERRPPRGHVVPWHLRRPHHLPARAHRRNDHERHRGPRCPHSGSELRHSAAVIATGGRSPSGDAPPGRSAPAVPGVCAADSGNRRRAGGGTLRPHAGRGAPPGGGHAGHGGVGRALERRRGDRRERLQRAHRAA